MKYLIIALLSLLPLVAQADEKWRLTEIQGKEYQPVGYIYHIESTGTQLSTKKIKAVSGLRFICSLKGGEPIIALFWDTGLGDDSEIAITPIVDGTQLKDIVWKNDGDLAYGNLGDFMPLVQSLKSSKSVRFQATTSDSVIRRTAFSLAGLDFTEFNVKCKTQL